MISIGFSTRKTNILSRLIRYFTKARFSHTWVRYWHPIFKCDVVIDADIRGIVEVHYEDYIKTIDDVVELIPPPGLDLTPSMTVMADVIGDDFDVPSMVGRLWVYLFRWLGKKVKNPLRNPKKDCCVENVLRLLVPADAVPKDIDPEVEDPQSVYNLLLARGWTTRPQLGDVASPGA